MPLSADARNRISQAQKKRWAAYRRAKKAGRPIKISRAPKKRGRRGRRAASSGNPYLRMTIEELVGAKRQIDEAWDVATSLLGQA
jgi:DNA invertase Pin-like site-specific DNA recombinase